MRKNCELIGYMLIAWFELLYCFHANSPATSLLANRASWLARNRVLCERHFIQGMHGVSRRIDNRRRDENHQVSLVGGAGFRPESPPDNRKIAQQRNLVFDLGDVLRDQTAKNHCLAIPHDGAGGDLPQSQVRQWQLS